MVLPGYNCIRGILVSKLAWSAVDYGFNPLSCQTKDYKIGICRFSVKYAELRSKNKDWLARNQNNVTCLLTDFYYFYELVL